MRSFSKQSWNKLYLIAGDGDFSEVIKHLVENENVAVIVIGTSGSISGELASYVRIIDFAEIRTKVAMNANSTPPPSGKVEEAVEAGSKSPTRTQALDQHTGGLPTSGYQLSGGSSFHGSKQGVVGEVRVTLGRLVTGVPQDLADGKQVDAAVDHERRS